MSCPVWLPDAYPITGDWHQDLTALYKIFEADFKHRRLVFRGTRILYDRRILEGDYEEGFWHLITRTDQGLGERVFDPRRAERLPWFGPIISNCEDVAATKVWVWKDDKRRLRTYIWLEEFDYVIILESRRGKVYFIVTAYHVDGAGRRKQLQTRYDARER